MKDHPERSARLQLIEHMQTGHSWQTAVAQSQLTLSRSTAYRLVQLARDEDKAELALLDRRHGHCSKLTKPVRDWLLDFCNTNPQVPSSRVRAELKTTFGVEVSIGHLNHVRAQLRISTQRSSQAQAQGKKN